jgi:hypothetical protein
MAVIKKYFDKKWDLIYGPGDIASIDNVQGYIAGK